MAGKKYCNATLAPYQLWPCVRPSVRLSVCHKSMIKRVERIEIVFGKRLTSIVAYRVGRKFWFPLGLCPKPVSYTHLTLPTIYSV